MITQWRITNPKVAKGIVALELAKDTVEAHTIVVDWNIAGAKQNTYIDFLFIVAYASFLFTGVSRISSLLNGWLHPVGKILAWLAPVAAILDVVENFKILAFLDDPQAFSTAFYVSALKWGIAGCLLLLFLLLSCVYLDQKRSIQIR